MASEDDRSEWNFGRLLAWHLLRGTRPGGTTDRPGRRWSAKALADGVGVNDRTVRYWLKNEHLPPEIETVERLLFGSDERYAEWRLELRNAHFESWRAKGNEDEPPARPSAETAISVSNIPIRTPKHFLGRDESLAAIDAAMSRGQGNGAIVALHGLRGVGKTTLAAAYAERHRRDWRAAWWIRAQTDSTMRADLVALATRFGWVAKDETEETTLTVVMERLRHEGDDILLVYDNVPDAEALRPYLPRGGGARALVTSNAHAWRGVAETIEISTWPKEIGADFLIARTGRHKERGDAEALTEAFGGLPLVHEHAAAYCERLDVPFAEYRKRFDAAPVRLLDDARHAPAEYHGGQTVLKTFTLAIEQAAKLCPAAQSLILGAALLAPEPIPLFFFSEAREIFGEPLASAMQDDGLDEIVATLRAFGLIERLTIEDQRDPTIRTDAIRLHRLVRRVAATRAEGQARPQALCTLLEAMARVYPKNVLADPKTWPRARMLDALALALVGDDGASPVCDAHAADLLDALASFRHGPLAAYSRAQPLYERALAIRKKYSGADHPDTAKSLEKLAGLLSARSEFASARPLYERALAICETALGPKHPDVARSLNNLAECLSAHGDLAGARLLFERTLAICETAFGCEDPFTATSLNNLAGVRSAQGDHVGARPLYERALAIFETALGPEHPATATALDNLAGAYSALGDHVGARTLFERALAIREHVLGLDHPETATSLNNLAWLLSALGDLMKARPLYERAVAIFETALGPEHPATATGLDNLAGLLAARGDHVGAQPLYERALAIRAKALGPEHSAVAKSLNNLAWLLSAQGDHAGARPLYERALAICNKVLGPEHPDTAASFGNLAVLLRELGDVTESERLFLEAIAIGEKALGSSHSLTQRYRSHYARLLYETGRFNEAITASS
ncbi:MAG: hypothetical protein C3F11_09345 [Methylocystaceae bacterium]|nr:MAG: hypothetical protein C3F11_09345 [Methylocystaceae bacterium]